MMSPTNVVVVAVNSRSASIRSEDADEESRPIVPPRLMLDHDDSSSVPPPSTTFTKIVPPSSPISSSSSFLHVLPSTTMLCASLVSSEDDNRISRDDGSTRNDVAASESVGLYDKEDEESPTTVLSMTTTTQEAEVESSSSTKRARTDTVMVQPARKRHRSASSSLDAASYRPLLTTYRHKTVSFLVAETTAKDHKKDEDDNDNGDEEDTAWDEAYFQLAFFKATQGTTNVPKDYVATCDDNLSSDTSPFQLGKWTAEQRTTLSAYLEAAVVGADHNKERLLRLLRLLPNRVQSRIKRLRDIGFEFHRGWDAYFSHLIAWNASKGHVDIPPDFVCNDSKLQLGKWLTQQRAELSAYLKCSGKTSVSLPSHIQLRIRKLIGVGLKESSNDYHAYFEQLISFKAATGHTKVSPDYIHKDSLLELGMFVTRQRAELSGYLLAGKINLPVPKLMMQRIEKFIDIDFEFYGDWDTFYIQLVVFKTSHNHTNVPSDYVCPGNRLPLGKWVSEQRVELSAYYQAEKENIIQLAKLAQLRIRDLLDLGFEFHQGWHAYYVQLISFRNSHGHTSVPFDYVCQGSLLPLGKWAGQQRAKISSYFKKAKTTVRPFQFLLSHETKLRIRELLDIGFVLYFGSHQGFREYLVWEWDEHYKLLLAYYDKHPQRHIPTDYETDTGALLGRWAQYQRYAYKLKLLGQDSRGYYFISENQIALLNALGFPWPQISTTSKA